MYHNNFFKKRFKSASNKTNLANNFLDPLFQFLILNFSFLIVFSCSPTEPVFKDQELTLDVDVEVVEAWIPIAVNPVWKSLKYIILRDSTIIFNGRISKSKFLFHDQNLEPNTTYTYSAFAYLGTEQIILILIFILLFMGHEGETQENKKYKLIVNSSNSESSLKKVQVARFFLKKVTIWKNNDNVFPVDLFKSSPIRKQFSEEILNKSISAVNAFWLKKLYSGIGIPPTEMKSNKEILKYVSENSGAIGYVLPSADMSKYKVKILEVL